MNSETVVEFAPRRIAVRQRQVLAVDDDPAQLKLTRARLIAEGYEVMTAASVPEALDVARRSRPDLVLSDVVMEEIDGFGLCTLFGADASLNDVPIVLITATVNEGDTGIASATGACTLVERTPDFHAEMSAVMRVFEPASGRDITSHRAQPSISRLGNQMAHLLDRSRAAEDRYRTLFENAGEVITVMTPDGVVLEVNRRWHEVFGRPGEPAVGRHIREFWPPEQQEGHLEIFREAVKSGVSRTAAVPVIGADGTPIHMEFSTSVVRVGGEEVVFSIGRDVTVSVIARQHLAATKEKYRALVENIPDVVWSATLDGHTTFMGPNALKVCGFTAEELLDVSPDIWFSRIHREDEAGVRAAFAAIVDHGYSVEYRWRHKDGHWIWLRSHARVRSLADGTLLVEGTFAEITEHKRLEEQLRQAQKMEAVGRLTGGIAHDFNNLLTVILGHGELLREVVADQDPLRADIEAVLDAGRRAAGLTRQLLAFSRRQVLETKVLDLRQIVSGLERMLPRLLGEDVDLSIVQPATLPAIRADAGQIEQVIMNLAVNARDAMPLGGRLSIETADVVLDAAHAEPLALPAGDYVSLVVSDTGCGMDDETLSRLFEPFFTTKELGKGTGLGLSTCYGIVKQSNGAIGVASQPGHGTRFTVYLPVSAAPLSAPVHAAVTRSLRGSETILLIEDNKALRTLAERILRGLGYRVLAARNGDDGIAIAGAERGAIDLLLCDVVMPGLSGPEVVGRIQRAGTAQPKVLFMSGYTDHAVLATHQLNASVNFIQKPFVPAAIAAKIREVLEAPAD